MQTKTPMLRTLYSFAARDGKSSRKILSVAYISLSPDSRYPLPLDRPLRLHPPPINLLHCPIRPLHHPNPTPQRTQQQPPFILMDNHRRRSRSRWSRGRDWQPSRSHPGPHVRRRCKAARRQGEDELSRCCEGVGADCEGGRDSHVWERIGAHGYEECVDECGTNCSVSIHSVKYFGR